VTLRSRMRRDSTAPLLVPERNRNNVSKLFE
jgi:hypothetical protein